MTAGGTDFGNAQARVAAVRAPGDDDVREGVR